MARLIRDRLGRGGRVCRESASPAGVGGKVTANTFLFDPRWLIFFFRNSMEKSIQLRLWLLMPAKRFDVM